MAAVLTGLLFSAACGQNRTLGQADENTGGIGIMEALEGDNPSLAKERAVSCMVRLDVAGTDEAGEDAEYYGSGIIWDAQGGRLIIATAGHLLEKGEILRVVFPDGAECGARVLGIDPTADVGFAEADYNDADGPCMVSLHQRIFDTLDENSPLFILAGSEQGAADLSLDVRLLEKAWYREEFGSDVMLLAGESKEGMSGAGVFDGCGHCIGMVVGGIPGETAVLSMEKINEAYGAWGGQKRDTAPYENDDN